MTPWERLDNELNRRKLGWQWVANGLHFDIQRVHNWKSRGIPPMHFRAIADLFGVTVDWIEGLEENTAQAPRADYNVVPTATRPQVPLISWVRAGDWGEIDDHNPDTTETVPAYYSNPSKYAFALTVDGDSMTSPVGLSFPHGCKLIADPERSPKAGDYVIAKDTLTQKATFKRLGTDGGRWYLQALNKDYKTIEIDHPEKRVIGVIIEFYIGGKL